MITLLILFATIAGIVYWLNRKRPSAPGNYNYSLDDRYNLEKLSMEEEVDRILEKINKKGMNSLSAKEKELLHRYSKVKS